MSNQELHSNPLAPSDDEMEEEERPQGKLSNADFRKLLMTPRVSSGSSSGAPQPPSTFAKPKPVEKKEASDASNARKKKKSYYAQFKKEEDDKDKDTKYRDRAKERRDGINTDQAQTIDVSTTANYKAVAPDARVGQSMAERRKQVIEESKYLGGDMEHTHLVKGLDYALLEKVKAEIAAQEMEELENAKNKGNDKEEEEEEEEAITFRTKFGRNIVRAALSRKGPVERNDLFLPGRMTYVFDLDDPYEDLPTTIIRSKADCVGTETSTTLSNNDIVINKLTQILSYLRQGKGRDKKKKDKKEREKSRKDEEVVEATNEDIFEGTDPGDHRSRGKHHRHETLRTERRDGEKRSYFEKPSEEESKFDESGPKMNAKDFIKNINDRYGKGNWGGITGEEEVDKPKAPSKDQQEKINKFNSQMEIDSYAECYPGMMEMVDALGDSDDEADYTKMDQGNKKGPVGRWDFETQEEYSSYMSSREALPKAAFQYGVKMADGRKTRRAGPRDEKKELDREWTKIQGIISKRKSDSRDVFASKKAKH